MAMPRAVRRGQPEYELQDVVSLAAKGAIWFAGARVGTTSEELGLTPDDVATCIASLQPWQFDRSLQYDTPTWLDVYIVRSYPCPVGVKDLYIKFKMFGGRLQLFVCSFHEEGQYPDDE